MIPKSTKEEEENRRTFANQNQTLLKEMWESNDPNHHSK